MSKYYYKSPLGSFEIRQEPEGMWILVFRDDVLAKYKSPVAAADDVYTQTTGDFDWDSYDFDDIPTGLDRWDRIE